MDERPGPLYRPADGFCPDEKIQSALGPVRAEGLPDRERHHVSHEGVVKRLALTLFALAAACGGSSGPTAPGPVAAMQAGTWVGILEVTSCGSSAYGCRTGGLEDFTLRLAADGRGVAQLIPRGGTPFGVDITSARQADGSWIATGALTAPDFDRSRIDAQIVLSQIDPASLTGTVTYTFTAREGAHTRSARILTSRAVNAVLPGRLHGTWIGFIERTSCTGTCESGYFAGSEFELAISHVQSSLIG